MTTIFVPPLDTVWRFTTDWTPPSSFLERSDNGETLFGFDKYPTTMFRKANPHVDMSGPGWLPAYRAWLADWQANHMPKFLAGTVVVFDRYHISHSGDHAITLRVLASPDQRLTPKKQGGKMRGAGRIYLRVEELNTFPELEKVDAADL